MNIKHPITIKGLAALLLGVTVVTSSCKKNDSPELPTTQLTESGESIMATTTTTSSNLLFQTSFEDGTAFNNLYQEKASANSIVRSTEQIKYGQYGAKFTLNKTDGDVAGSKRVEITPIGPEQNPKAERWYGLSVFLPNSFVTDPSEENIFQWHGVSSVSLDGYSMNNPPISMMTQNGRWKLNIKTKDVRTTIDLGDYNKNVWTNWVFHIKFSHQSDGVLEVWKNGQRVLARNAPNTYYDKVGNFFKFGIYKFGWKIGQESSTTQRVVYFDEVKIGNENSSFEEISPKSNTSTPTSPTSPTSPTPTTPTTQANVVAAINAGGGAYTATNGITYSADKNYSGGLTMKTTNSISNTNDDALYQSDRFGDFSYRIPVSNGTYEVTLKFAEFKQLAENRRIFDVSLEGIQVLSNLDIFKLANGYRAHDVVKTCIVKDGQLLLTFKGDKNYAKVSAFHIIKK